MGKRSLKDGIAAARAGNLAELRPDYLQIVVYLRNRSDGGARARDAISLFESQSRSNPANGIQVGTMKAVEKLPGVGTEGLDIPPAALGIDCIEGKRGLTRAGYTGYHR